MYNKHYIRATFSVLPSSIFANIMTSDDSHLCFFLEGSIVVDRGSLCGKNTWPKVDSGTLMFHQRWMALSLTSGMLRHPISTLSPATGRIGAP